MADKALSVFYRGNEAGVLTRNKDGFYIFERTGDDFPFVTMMLSLQRPSRELPSLFETILSQGSRAEALHSKCASDDPMDLLPFVTEHPVFSFRPMGERETNVKRSQNPFPAIPFGVIHAGEMMVPDNVAENPENRFPDELSVFSGMQDKMVVVCSPSGVRLPSRHEYGNAIMKSALPGSVHHRFESFVLNEHLFTTLAGRIGITAAETCLFRPDVRQDDRMFLLSKRFDVTSDSRRLLCVEGPAFLDSAVSDREKYTYPVADFFRRFSSDVCSAMAEAVFFSYLAGNCFL